MHDRFFWGGYLLTTANPIGIFVVLIYSFLCFLSFEQSVCVRYGLGIGGACAPFVLAMMWIFCKRIPILFPIFASSKH